MNIAELDARAFIMPRYCRLLVRAIRMLFFLGCFAVNAVYFWKNEDVIFIRLELRYSTLCCFNRLFLLILYIEIIFSFLRNSYISKNSNDVFSVSLLLYLTLPLSSSTPSSYFKTTGTHTRRDKPFLQLLFLSCREPSSSQSQR